MLRGPVKRRTPPRLRVFFLRQLRQCGEVSLAAKRTGVPLSTVYRWRERDAKFRRPLGTLSGCSAGRSSEDRLMAIIREGELRPVYHKGLEVGCGGRSPTVVSIRVLDYFDRRATAKNRHTMFPVPTAAESAKKPEGSAA